MTHPAASSPILDTAAWPLDRPVLRLPWIGEITTDSISRFVSRLAFVLLMAAAGTLLVHPGDLVPDLADMPAYQVLVSACLLASSPRVVARFTATALRRDAITTLVLFGVVAAVMSHLARFDIYSARMSGMAVGKLALFYLLVVVVIDSPRRLRVALAAVAACVLAMTIVAVLQYHGIVHLPGMARVVQDDIDPATGESTSLMRLCGIGLFNDPNDLSLVLVVSAVVTGYYLTDDRLGRRRLWLCGPLALFAYALYLTHSRGGVLSALAGLFMFLWARIGGRNTLAAACVIVPLVILPSWGRQTHADLDNPDDTFQTRLELWSESLTALRASPMTGVGQGRLIDEIGQVAHNSYVHAYAETGLLGGTAFLGTVYLLLRGLSRADPTDDELARMRPYVLAIVGGYAAGMLSLSRCYHAPTALLLGLGTAYLTLAPSAGPAVGRDGRDDASACALPWLDARCIRRIMVAGLLFLLATYLFVRLMLQRGAA